MRLRSIGILSVLGLLGLVLAAQTALAQGMTPGQAAPPLPSVDLTRPGSPRIPARPVAAVPAPAPAATAPAAAPPATTKAAAAKAKPTGTAGKKTTTKAPPKAAKGKPPAKPTQTAVIGDR